MSISPCGCGRDTTFRGSICWQLFAECSESVRRKIQSGDRRNADLVKELIAEASDKLQARSREELDQIRGGARSGQCAPQGRRPWRGSTAGICPQGPIRRDRADAVADVPVADRRRRACHRAQEHRADHRHRQSVRDQLDHHEGRSHDPRRVQRGCRRTTWDKASPISTSSSPRRPRRRSSSIGMRERAAVPGSK